jgi:intracellular septation protein
MAGFEAAAPLSAIIRGHLVPPRAPVQALYDFLPVVAFFVTMQVADIYRATAVLMVATVAVAACQWYVKRKISSMLLVSAVLALVFGGLTLYFRNPMFIMWKPSILYTLIALACLASQIFGEQTLIEKMMGEQIRTDARTWRIANVSWALFFLVLAGANLYVAYHFSLTAFATWKLICFGVIFLFSLALGVWLSGRAEAVAP